MREARTLGSWVIALFLAAMLVWVAVDTLARTMTSAELPLGILTAVIGAPVFIYLLCTRRTRGGPVR